MLLDAYWRRFNEVLELFQGLKDAFWRPCGQWCERGDCQAWLRLEPTRAYM